MQFRARDEIVQPPAVVRQPSLECHKWTTSGNFENFDEPAVTLRSRYRCPLDVRATSFNLARRWKDLKSVTRKLPASREFSWYFA